MKKRRNMKKKRRRKKKKKRRRLKEGRYKVVSGGLDKFYCVCLNKTCSNLAHLYKVVKSK